MVFLGTIAGHGAGWLPMAALPTAVSLGATAVVAAAMLLARLMRFAGPAAATDRRACPPSADAVAPGPPADRPALSPAVAAVVAAVLAPPTFRLPPDPAAARFRP